MPSLSNDLLREKTMREFLTAMGIDIAGVNVSSEEGLYNFSFTEKRLAGEFAKKLGAVLKPDAANQAVKSISLSDIIDQNIAQAVCDDKDKLAIHRASCTAIFTIIKASSPEYKYLKETGEIEITLPGVGYVGLLESLRYPHLRLTKEGKVVINLKEYLRAQPEAVVIMEGLNSAQPPLVFVQDRAFQTKSIFYATKQLQDLSTQITPYFFVPQTTTPPNYHFALDVSSSMRSSLPQLESSVKKLIEQLFQFQPDAKISITTFSEGVHFLGTFSRANLTRMNGLITGLQTKDSTALHEATGELVEEIAFSSGQQNNIFFFTDGGENGSKSGSMEKILQLIAKLQNDLRIVARNKFYVFNYCVTSDDVVNQVVKTFQSETVDTASPDFMAAQADPELMKRWAASRELFTARVIVEDQTKSNSGDESTPMVLNMSGQLHALKPRICKPGETVAISITDGDGKTIAKSAMTVPLVAEPSAAASAGAAVASVAGPSVTVTVAAPSTSAYQMRIFASAPLSAASANRYEKDVKSNCL